MTAAVFVISTQFTAIAAATPTLPPPWPDWPEPWLLPLEAESCELGSVPVPVLLVFELPDTWLLAWLSALFEQLLLPEFQVPPPDSQSLWVPALESFVLPFALAWTSATTLAVEVDLIVIAPAPVMFRAVEPSVWMRTTLTAMIAPTATSLPAASAS